MTKSNFAHLGCYARKGKTDAAFILDEAGRVPRACKHIQTPQPAIHVAGLPLIEFRTTFDRLIEAAHETTREGVKRSIRSSQHILLGTVASYPVTMADLVADPSAWREYEDWQQRAAAFLLAVAEEKGAVISILAHHDEGYPHLHGLLASTDPAMRAKLLHPGYTARMAEQAAGVKAGLAPSEANRNGRRAYGDAMREFQDRYHAAVGRPCGHSRLIVGRVRRPRGEALDLRAVHDARDEAIQARNQADRDRAEIVAEAQKQGYAQGLEEGYRVADTAVAAEVTELNSSLDEAERRTEILRDAWQAAETRVTELEQALANAREYIEQLLASPEETAAHRW